MSYIICYLEVVISQGILYHKCVPSTLHKLCSWGDVSLGKGWVSGTENWRKLAGV